MVTTEEGPWVEAVWPIVRTANRDAWVNALVWRAAQAAVQADRKHWLRRRWLVLKKTVRSSAFSLKGVASRVLVSR